MVDLLEQLERVGAPYERRAPAAPAFLIVDAAGDPTRTAAYRRLRAAAFVDEQALFARHDRDHHDEDVRTKVLVAVGADGAVLGGVRVHPAVAEGQGLGWWQGSRLVCAPGSRPTQRAVIGAALVRAACAVALNAGALRFDAQVQERMETFFARLGWTRVRDLVVAGRPHVLMRFPIDRIAQLAEATKAPLAGLLDDVLTPSPWLGDDGAPVAGTDVVACTDAIVPAMVERDPAWAGWCAMLVTAHDLAAMGAAPVGALDALGARDADAAARVVAGLRDGAEAFGLPILGGHTQLGVPAALSVTGLGRTADPIPAGGGRTGDPLTITADLGGRWRPGYAGRQWDSTTHRTRDEQRAMHDAVAAARPRAAKDISMAGIVGTTGMLAEASGCGATLDVARIPRPDGVTGGDWLTCFPGYAMVTAGEKTLDAGPAVSAHCGVLTTDPGVRLRWPDGDVTVALTGGVTGLGPTTTTEAAA